MGNLTLLKKVLQNYSCEVFFVQTNWTAVSVKTDLGALSTDEEQDEWNDGQVQVDLFGWNLQQKRNRKTKNPAAESQRSIRQIYAEHECRASNQARPWVKGIGRFGSDRTKRQALPGEWGGGPTSLLRCPSPR